MSDVSTKILLHKSDDDRSPVEAQANPSSSLLSALSRLEGRIPALRHRFFWSKVGFFFGTFLFLFALVLHFFLAPSHAPLVWPHIQYPSGIDSALQPGGSFVKLSQALVHFVKSPLVVLLSVATILVGIAKSVMFNSPAPAFLGVSMAVTLQFGAPVVLAVIGPGSMAEQPVSVQNLSVKRLEELRDSHTRPAVTVPLLWVLVQKQYFGKPGSHFAQEVATLDQAYLRHNRYLPDSVTAAKLLVVNQKAGLQNEATTLRKAELQKVRNADAVSRFLLGPAWFGFFVELVSGSVAVLLRLRILRLRNKLAPYPVPVESEPVSG